MPFLGLGLSRHELAHEVVDGRAEGLVAGLAWTAEDE